VALSICRICRYSEIGTAGAWRSIKALTGKSPFNQVVQLRRNGLTCDAPHSYFELVAAIPEADGTVNCSTTSVESLLQPKRKYEALLEGILDNDMINRLSLAMLL
jgi:hypothetical protein